VEACAAPFAAALDAGYDPRIDKGDSRTVTFGYCGRPFSVVRAASGVRERARGRVGRMTAVPAKLFLALTIYVVAAMAVGLGGVVPLAASVVAGGAAMLLWYVVSRPHELRQARKANGLCPECGYDLTGNVSGVCPECGSAGRGD
jgi:hypothetical protein